MEQHTKTTKIEAYYQATPNNGNKCEMCVYFLSKTNECKIVEGKIDPNGWCKFFH